MASRDTRRPIFDAADEGQALRVFWGGGGLQAHSPEKTLKPKTQHPAPQTLKHEKTQDARSQKISKILSVLTA
jgi:hypothetical protein